MKKYTKPTAQVVELSVKEAISLNYTDSKFGYQGKEVTLRTYTASASSVTIEEKIG